MRNGFASNGVAIPPEGSPRSLAGRTGGEERIGSISPAERLLERLERVKKTRPDRWQARCPAHDDRSPSLAISANPDGTILIRCWAGCSAADIVAALGLQLRDLFPSKFNPNESSRGRPPRYSPSEVLRTALFEAQVLYLGYRSVQRGKTLPLKDQGRIELAIQTLANLRAEVG